MAVASGVFACWEFLSFFCLVSLLMMDLLLWSCFLVFFSSYAAPSSKLLGKRNLPSQHLLIQTLRRWLILPYLPHQSYHTTTPLFQHHCWEPPIPTPCKWIFLGIFGQKTAWKASCCICRGKKSWINVFRGLKIHELTPSRQYQSTFAPVFRKPKIIASLLKCKFFIGLLSQQNVLSIKNIYNQGDLEVPE